MHKDLNVILSIGPDSLQPPKRPRTAYNFFFHDERKKLLANLPAPPVACDNNGRRICRGRRGDAQGRIGFAEMGKIIGAKWRAIAAEDRNYYTKLANRDKLRYHAEKSAYKAQVLAHLKGDSTLETTRMIDATNLSRCEPSTGCYSAPIPWTSKTWNESIADLAKQLDEESIDLIISSFKK